LALLAESDAEDARRARKRGGGRRRGAKPPEKHVPAATEVLADSDPPDDIVTNEPPPDVKSHVVDAIEKVFEPSPQDDKIDAPPALEPVEEVPALEFFEKRAPPVIAAVNPEAVGLVSWGTFGTSKMSFEYVPHYVEYPI
jgi:hypothetical protein